MEALHAQVNADLRTYAPVHDDVEKLRLVFNLHCQRATANSAGIDSEESMMKVDNMISEM